MANENNNPKVTIDGITITVNQEEFDYLALPSIYGIFSERRNGEQPLRYVYR